MGRETVYDAEIHVPEAARLAGEGAMDSEIAEAFGIKKSTISDWKKAHPELAEAIRKARVRPIREVAKRVYEHATMKTLRETHYKAVPGARAGDPVKLVVDRVVEREVKPSERAAEFYLTNKSRAWKKKLTVEGAADPNKLPSYNEADVAQVMQNVRRLRPDLFAAVAGGGNGAHNGKGKAR